jgi:hypothetical protein
VSGSPVQYSVAAFQATTTMPFTTVPIAASWTSGEAVSLQGNYSSLIDMWDEWHGTGLFFNQPVTGGFGALEVEKKGAWQKHFTKSEEQELSRIKRLVNATTQHAKITNKEGSEREILLIWDLLFKAGGRSIRKLVDLFQSEQYNLIPRRKPRGRNA